MTLIALTPVDAAILYCVLMKELHRNDALATTAERAVIRRVVEQLGEA